MAGLYRYNWIEDAFGPSANGIQFYGAGESLFHHNVIVNLDEGTGGRFPVYAARDGYLPGADSQSLVFLHNTFVGFGGLNDSRELVRIFTDIGELISRNNLFVESQGDQIAGDAEGNVIASTRGIFRGAGARDLGPANGSPQLNAAVTQSRVSHDILGRVLPDEYITSGAIQAPVVIFYDDFEGAD